MSMLPTSFARLLATCCVAATLSAGSVHAQAPASTAPGQAPPTAAPTATPPRKQISLKAPLNGTADQLTEWLAEMIIYTPQNEKELAEFQKTATGEMNVAARKIIQIETDRTSDNYLFAYKYIMAIEAMSVDGADPTRRQALVAQVTTMLQHPQMDGDDLDIAVTLAEGLEMAGDRAMATKAYTDFSKILATNSDAEIVQLSKLMAGAARRLNLMGNPITVVGTAVDGQAFDWKAYQGRVVLIDFWATWCGPCVKEIPNVAKAYEAYRAKGFEVVGISMDRDTEQLKKYLAENPMPWRTLNEGNNANPTAQHYGINQVPAALLIDQQGRVVSMNARGEELTKLLEKLLGPAS